MSWWTHINGMIKVSPMGRTQEEKTYILNTVLKHLPLVTGSEGDMEVYVNECTHGSGTSSSSRDEFDMQTNNLRDMRGHRSYRNGWLNCNENYVLTISYAFRDREFEQTLKEFEAWLQRLAKRVSVRNILVKVEGYGRKYVFDNYEPYYRMFEYPSWCSENGESNWCEYLMWSRYKGWSLPLELIHKYYDDDEADVEFERRSE